MHKSQTIRMLAMILLIAGSACRLPSQSRGSGSKNCTKTDQKNTLDEPINDKNTLDVPDWKTAHKIPHQKKPLSIISAKRLAKEQAILAKLKPTIDDHGDFFQFVFNSEIQSQAKLIMAGPVDTPYEGALFHFDYLFPSDFPHQPPLAYFRTKHRSVEPQYHGRVSPNLYQDGKVCLSMYGTWGKSTWAPSIRLEGQIQSLRSESFRKNPLESEPGKSGNKKKDADYAQKIRSRVEEHYILKNIEKPDPDFKDVTKHYYCLHGPKILQRMKADQSKFYPRVEQALAKLCRS